MTNCYTAKAKVCDSQIVVLTNFIVVSSVGIKRVVCMLIALLIWSYAIVPPTVSRVSLVHSTAPYVPHTIGVYFWPRDCAVIKGVQEGIVSRNTVAGVFRLGNVYAENFSKQCLPIKAMKPNVIVNICVRVRACVHACICRFQ